MHRYQGEGVGPRLGHDPGTHWYGHILGATHRAAVSERCAGGMLVRSIC